MNVLRKLCITSIKTAHRTSCSVLLQRQQFSQSTVLNISTKNPSFATPVTQNQVFDQPHEIVSEEDHKISDEIISKINTQIKEKSHSRLFAIVKLGEFRFKITAEDIIALGQFFPAKVGDRICLDKVLVVGSSDFTLLGRPLLHKDLVRIEATVIEKTYIVPRPLYRHGVHYRRLHWFRTPYVLFRINSIEFKHTLDDLPDVENINNRVIY